MYSPTTWSCEPGTLHCIWRITAIDDANFFVEEQRYALEELNTTGWIVLGIGVLELIAAFSIRAGGRFGRWIGVIAWTRE